jgi:ABC-2 type transport system permease protein
LNGHLLWFLLRHEFRLRQRDPRTNLWYLAQVYLVLYLCLGVFTALIWASPHHRTIHLFNPLPNIFPVVSGCIINVILLSSFGNTQKTNRKNFDTDPFIEHLYAAPISSRILLTSHLFNKIILGALTSIGVFPIWFFLATFYSTPQFIISLPLVTILVIAFQESLLLWSIAIKKLIKINITKIIGDLFILAIISFIVFISSLLALVKSRALPITVAAEWFSSAAPFAKALLNGFTFIIQAFVSDNWLWAPGRATLLDPLSTLTFILICLGFVWLTIQILNRRLIRVLKTPITESRFSKIRNKSIKFKSNLTWILIQREWRQNRISPFDRFKQIISILMMSYLCTLFSGSSDPRAIASLAIGTVYFPAFVAFANAPHCFVVEDSLALLKSAPISMRYIGWCKRLAVLIPLWILLLPIIILVGAMGQPWGWVLFFVIIAPLCQVILRSWNTVPNQSSSLKNELLYSTKSAKIYRDFGVFFLEFLSLSIWTICLFLILIEQNLLGCLTLGLEVCLIALAYRRNLQLGDIWEI